MSHELRTPLNSLLILAKLLADNQEANLTDKQVEYAKTIYASGGDLLTLINEILDLSKVEAGKMPVEPRDIALARDRATSSSASFRPVAEQKGLEFATEVDAGAAAHDLHRPAAAAAGAEEPARQRLQVHRRGQRSRCACSRPQPGTRFANEALRTRERGGRLLGRRHRHRHRRRTSSS